MATAKISGKSSEFWWDGVEIPVESVTTDKDFSTIDVTDSSVPSPGTSVLIGRQKNTAKVDAFLYKVAGTEVVTGDLVAGITYRVTLGTITEGAVSYAVGTIFTSDGSGDASAENKVRPLGVCLEGKNISMTVATADLPIVSFKYNEAYGEFDATDSDTNSDYTESVIGRRTTTMTVEVMMRTETADLLTAAPTSKAFVVTFDTGYTLTATGIFSKKSSVDNMKGDIVKQTYEIQIIGAVTFGTFDAITILPAATAETAIVKFFPGTSTNKQYSGSAQVMSRSIETDINAAVKISYGITFDGAVTEAVAN
jgi:hypothetical protein